MGNFLNKFYPFFSLAALEVGTLIEHSYQIITIIVFLLQLIIGILTIIKIWKDIKRHRYKSIDQSEKEMRKQKPFLYAILEYLKRFKRS